MFGCGGLQPTSVRPTASKVAPTTLRLTEMLIGASYSLRLQLLVVIHDAVWSGGSTDIIPWVSFDVELLMWSVLLQLCFKALL